MVSAVIFDMDGLMFDTESAYSVVHNRIFKKRNKIFTKEIKMEIMGKRSQEIMKSLSKYLGQNENVEDLLREQDGELVKIYLKSVNKLKGLDELIEFLNMNNIKKCIGTSSRKFLVDILLNKYNLKSEFKFIISGDNVKKGKPNPEIYLECLKKLKVPAKNCLILEDSLNGVIAGNSAGCQTCAIPSKYTRHEDFSIANLVVKSLNDKVLKEYIFKK